MVELAQAGLAISQDVAEELGVSVSKLMMLVSVGVVHPRPKKVGRMFLWTAEDVDRARASLADLQRKRAESKAKPDHD